MVRGMVVAAMMKWCVGAAYSRQLRLFCLCGLGLSTPCVQAAEWVVEPHITTSITYDDNVFFTQSQPVDSVGVQVLTGISLNRNTENLVASLSGSLLVREYEDDALVDSVDPGIAIDLNRIGERHHLGFSADYKRQTTLFSEIDSTGPVQLDRRVNRISLQPSWRYQFSPLASVQLNYTWSDTDYDALPTEFSDYTNQVLQLGYQYGFTERTSLGLQYLHSELDIPDTGVAGLPGVKSLTKSDAFYIGLNHKFGKTVNFDLQIGNRNTEEKVTYVPFLGQPVFINKGEGRLYSINVNRIGENLSVGFSAKQDLTPASNGQLNETETFRANISWVSSRRSRINLTIGHLRTKPAISSSQVERQYSWVKPSINYKLGERSSLIASYQYARQKLGNAAEAADSNSLIFSLKYQWPGTTLN